MWDIVYDTNNIVYDYGTITREDFEGQQDMIKVVKPDGYVYYIGAYDRQYWVIKPNVDNIPQDFMACEYIYNDGVWTKITPPPVSGSTQN